MITMPAILRGRAIKENVDMDELISKRAVIEAIEKARANVGHNLERSIGKSITEILDEVGRDVDRLPSALGTNLAEVGTDCISRQEAIDRLTEYGNGRAVFISVGEAVIRIEQLPSAEPKRGKWSPADSLYHGAPFYYCSECGEKMLDTVMGKPRGNFCPHCGADMRGDKNA